MTTVGRTQHARHERDRPHRQLEALLQPASIAVVGASGDPRTIPGMLFQNLLRSPFEGLVLPVNPNHDRVAGIHAYRDLPSCPVVPDLVVVCVPAPAVLPVVTDATRIGAGAVCVISAGFAETGADGADLERELVRTSAEGRLRMVGPNCTGVLAGSAKGRFNATFSRVTPPDGGASIVSESGAVGVALLDAAMARHIGIRDFVSVGNCADITSCDLLEHWRDDDATGVVLMYLESIREPARFIRVAREVTRRVPVVALKAGRSRAGLRAAGSHTAALAAGDAAVDAVLRQAGIMRVGSLEELLDVAQLTSAHVTPRGRGVAIVTNGGGPGILAADACEGQGLDVPELDHATAARLRASLPPEASVANPVDMISAATAEDYRRVTQEVAAAPGIDTVMVVVNTPLLTGSDEIATELVRARARMPGAVPLIGVFMNRDGPPAMLADAGIPSFSSPELAARALVRLTDWQDRRRRPRSRARQPAGAGRDTDDLVATARRQAADGWIRAIDAQRLLEAYGVRLPRTIAVHTANEAVRAFRSLAPPVVVKLDAPVHKSDIGGVRLDVRTARACADAVRFIRSSAAREGRPELGRALLVQEQVTSGVEMIVGATRDPVLGPMVLVGLGGSVVELLGDVALGRAPLTEEDIDDMLRSLKGYPLLTGFRGAPNLDVDSLRAVLRNVSSLVDEVPDIVEVDLNPVVVLQNGAVAVDCRLRFDPQPHTAPGRSLD